MGNEGMFWKTKYVKIEQLRKLYLEVKSQNFMFQLFKQKKILSAVVNRERYKKIYSDE